jgi:hypothetical protein
MSLLFDIGSAVADGASWAVALVGRAGLAMTSAANEFLFVFQSQSLPTNSPTSYEKATLLVEAACSDPSDYTKGITRAKPAINATATIRATPSGVPNPTGRCWGLYSQAGIAPDGSNGLCVSHECSIDTFLDQPLLDQIDSKVGTSWVGGEEAPGHGTAAGVINKGSGGWYMGLIANRSAFVDQNNAPAFAVRDTNGQTLSEMRVDGRFVGMTTAKFFNTATRSTAELRQQFTPAKGDVFVWGISAEQKSYMTYFDGTGFALYPQDGYVV